MTEMNQQPCPLCATPSPFDFSDFMNRKRFSCPGCGSFVITVRAEKRLADSPPKWREQLKIMVANVPEDNILEIRLHPVNSRKEGIGYQVFDTEQIPR